MRDVRDGAALTGFRRSTWYSLAGTDVVFLVGFGAEWIADPALTLAVRLAAVLALGVLVAAVVVLLRRRLPLGLRDTGFPGAAPGIPRPAAEVAADIAPARLGFGWAAAGCVAAAVLGAVALAVGEPGTWSVPPAVAVSVVATFLPRRARRILIGVAAVLAGAVGAAVGLPAGAGWLSSVVVPAGMVVFVAWITLGMLWACDLAERLDSAREVAADLAVADERLRFAADLHDVQGHHLQVIALKSELAARLARVDPDRAAAEMAQVRRLATDALRDTREVAAGYRRTSLDAELANAARVLAAADIDTRLEVEPVDPALLPGPGRHLLGLMVREATTNVLRHSRARRAEVAYRVADGAASLSVANDGAPRTGVDDTLRAGDDTVSAGSSATGVDLGPAGAGLRSLQERLAAAGGSLRWRRDGDWFEVVASLPVEGRSDHDAGGAP